MQRARFQITILVQRYVQNRCKSAKSQYFFAIRQKKRAPLYALKSFCQRPGFERVGRNLSGLCFQNLVPIMRRENYAPIHIILQNKLVGVFEVPKACFAEFGNDNTSGA
ncbi:MAG: hypothetical protein C9356_03830 [Oleiphilus sp.]|nr:MAG: hypothetical protein C9356_03830 [Oleiphilus sp.]